MKDLMYNGDFDCDVYARRIVRSRVMNYFLIIRGSR